MRNTIGTAIILIVLLSCLAGATFMGYRGYGVVEAGPSAGSPSIRGGSLLAPSILGGGPGSGK